MMQEQTSRVRAEDKQRGAIFVEATISLSVFMFFMFTLLTLIQIAYVQARVSVALDSVTKQLAEYAHVYYATGLDQTMSGSGGKSSAFANEVAEFLQDLSGYAPGELGEYISGAGTALEGDSLSAFIKHGVGGLLVENMLVGRLDDGFCEKNRIVGGFNTAQCKFLENGSDIFLQVKYDVQVIKLLNIDYTFHLSSCSYTQAWSGE